MTELSKDAKELLDMIEDCDGAEVYKDDWVHAEELVAVGLITLGNVRGPGQVWKRAELK